MTSTGAPPSVDSAESARVDIPSGAHPRPFSWSRPTFAILALVYAAFQTLLSSIDTSPALDVLGREGFLRKAGQTASNFAHVPLFAGLSALAFFAIAPNGYHDLARRQGPTLTLLAAFLFGVADELHQAFVPGRFPSLLDVGSDVVGAALALALLGAFGARRVLVAGACVVAGVVVSAIAAVGKDPGVVPFRRIADLVHGYPGAEFEAALDDVRAWRRNVPDPALTIETVATPRGHELRLSLPPSPWPGVVTRATPFDWTGYRRLEVTLRNESGTALRFGVRVDDLSSMRHEAERDLLVGETALEFPLEPFSRTVDMTRVDTLLLFLSGNDATRSLAITSIRLLK